MYHPSISLRPLHFPSSAYINVDADNHVIIFASDKGFGLVAIGKTGIEGNINSTWKVKVHSRTGREGPEAE